MLRDEGDLGIGGGGEAHVLDADPGRGGGEAGEARAQLVVPRHDRRHAGDRVGALVAAIGLPVREQTPGGDEEQEPYEPGSAPASLVPLWRKRRRPDGLILRMPANGGGGNRTPNFGMQSRRVPVSTTPPGELSLDSRHGARGSGRDLDGRAGRVVYI